MQEQPNQPHPDDSNGDIHTPESQQETIYQHPSEVPVEIGDIIFNGGHLKEDFSQSLDEILKYQSARLVKVERGKNPKNYLVVSGEDLADWLAGKLLDESGENDAEEPDELPTKGLVAVILFGIRQQIGQYYSPEKYLQSILSVFEADPDYQAEFSHEEAAALVKRLKRTLELFGEKIKITQDYLNQQLVGVKLFYDKLIFWAEQNPEIEAVLKIGKNAERPSVQKIISAEKTDEDLYVLQQIHLLEQMHYQSAQANRKAAPIDAAMRQIDIAIESLEGYVNSEGSPELKEKFLKMYYQSLFDAQQIYHLQVIPQDMSGKSRDLLGQ